MYQVNRINEQGFILEPVVVEDGVILADEDIVSVPVPEGFYTPRWDGEQWVEGKPQEEIDAIQNAPAAPSAEERIQALEAEVSALKAQLGGV